MRFSFKGYNAPNCANLIQRLPHSVQLMKVCIVIVIMLPIPIWHINCSFFDTDKFVRKIAIGRSLLQREVHYQKVATLRQLNGSDQTCLTSFLILVRIHHEILCIIDRRRNRVKKFIIIEICVIVALVIGFWIGRLTSPFNDYTHYYKNADNAWIKVQELNNPPVTIDDPDKKRLNEVRAAYRAVFDNYPDAHWADDALYQLALLPRTDEEAFALYRRLIRDYPDSEFADDSIYAIAFASYKIGDELREKGTLESVNAYYDRAISLFTQLITIYPGSVLEAEAQFNIAMCYRGKGDLNAALTQLDNIRIEYRENQILHKIIFYTGDIYYDKQEYENARIEFKNVVDFGDPNYAPFASYKIAETYFAEREYEDAIQACQKVIELYPDTPFAEDANFYIAQPFEKLERYDEAITHLEDAIAQFPDNGSIVAAKYYLAQIYQLNQDFDRAIEAFQVFADDPTHVYDHRLSAQYEVAEIYRESEDMEQAIEAYEKLLKDFPDPHQRADHPSRQITENYVQTLKTEYLSEN